VSTETADLVVIGGGIMGLSIAYQVARRSDQRVVVVEKGSGLGEGSTGGSAAITRQRYSQPENIRISRDGNRVFRNWADYTGLAAPRAEYHAPGVLWMMNEDRGVVEADRDRLRAEGVDAVVIGPAELADRFPALSACIRPFDLSGAIEHECRDGEAFLLEQDAGYFDATGALEDIAEAARNRGVDLRMRARVDDVIVRGGRALGVVLGDGTRIDGGHVVNAAGPWCNQINAMAGLELKWDLRPTRVQVIYRELPPEIARPIPVVGDASTGIYFRPESAGQQILMGSILEEDEQEVVDDPDDFNRTADRGWIDTKIHGLHHRIPSLPHRGQMGGMAGLYTINHHDVHPVIGPTAIDGFSVVNGFSGHGFKESQMVGSMMARWLTGESASYDTEVPMSFLSVDRQPISVAAKTVLA
jgi:sarcosine oxidase, subunit beta